ncbi:hypothetical protein F0562_028081 [Nyssa sinensis]|uniref:Uncharacterized protein n=1 Tax=Nyssa sinensis TaxID=561372 RepID=A0A5J5B587_9ASTE|nr:hypothetical protein F0562_028081 [Nyssa sinensis]
MGCCISKCRPKRKSHEDQFNHVQDKLVISQAPVSPIPLSIRKPHSPSPSPSSTTSFSSFSCTASNSCSLTASLSLSSSCSSSVLSPKDRSFSNEFLWSCVKENPHIMRVDTLKACPLHTVATKVHARKLESPAKPIVAPVKQSMPQRLVGSTPQKRPRASSPNLTRQKSFRKEPEKPNSTNPLPSRTLRSPSPSRRFTGDNYRGVLTNTAKENCCKRLAGSKIHAVNSESSCVRKENHRPASPNNNSSRNHAFSRNNERCIYQIGSKIDGIAVGEVVSNAEMDCVPMEDIDNPLIALDCFIFLDLYLIRTTFNHHLYGKTLPGATAVALFANIGYIICAKKNQRSIIATVSLTFRGY